ncbi:MAG: hypothetical protein GW903_00785 [Alphaproteobacteria bacterium]|nr:hypothetical protein [Alphaproteobacteria bacterium]NCQ87505.1 hypothetical protein [Alphaproteobacteria bacterium]
MTRIRQTKTNFTSGEVSDDLLGRGDLRAYQNGALALRNLFIFPTGGVTRRAGLRYIDTAAGDGRLIPFEFNTQQTYLLVLTANQIAVYLEGALAQTLIAPWPLNDINQVTWTQSADTLLMVHPDYSPKRLIRNALGQFVLEDWVFFTDGNISYQPFYKFAKSDVTITPSGVSGNITLTTSTNIFTPYHAGTRLRVSGKQVEITSYDSPTVVSVTVIEELGNTDATIDWEEQAFSQARGYPSSVAFHQDRLVIGGSRDLPNRLWFSRSGDLFNFDLGTGLDDEAIEFAILSDQVNAIRGIFSGRHLQVFTSGAEWMVTGDPLTPETVQLNRQTRVGSVIERYIPPVTVDGATLFVARNKKEMREFLYTDIEQAYQATDIALLSRHIIKEPIDQDFDTSRRLLFIVREDGRFATLTMYRAEQVAAWTLHDTLGKVRSVSVVGDNVFMLIERNGNYQVELFDDALNLDSALDGQVAIPTSTWSGLDHLEGQSVSIIADGVVQDDQNVLNGAVTLNAPASAVEIGLPYTHVIKPLPPSAVGQGVTGRKLRLIEVLFRLQETQALRLDVGRGLKDVPLKQIGQTPVLNAPPPSVSKDIRVRALGWQQDNTDSLWRIEQSLPYPFTLLSVTEEIKIND